MAIVLDGTAGITTPDLTDTSLTSGRVVYAGTSGNLTGSDNLTFSGTSLTLKTGYYEAYDPVDTTSAGVGMRFYTNGGGTKTENGRLTVSQTATSGSLSSMIFQTNNGTSLAEQMRLTSTGLGIGTSSPAYKLDVAGQFSRIGQSGGAGAGLILAGASAAKNWVIASQYNLSGTLEFTQTTAVGGSTISGTPSMVINASGDVGIGQTSPTAALDVNRSSATNGLMLNLQNTSTGSFIQFAQPGVANLFFGCPNADAFVWKTFGSGTYPERMRLDSSGNLLIATTTSPSSSGVGSGFVIDSDGRASLIMRTNTTSGRNLCDFGNPNGSVGSISVSGSATAYNTSSDYRLKNTIAPMTGALAKVAQLKPVTYKWNADSSDCEGFIAHELAEVVPHAVTGAKDAVDADGKPIHQGIDTSFLVATLTAAIQEQQALIITLTERITALEGA
jgi:hypothetical protein